MNNSINLNLTEPERSSDWIDALAHRATKIGQWDVEGYWPRLANLAFHAVLLDRLLGDKGKPRWNPPLTPAQTFATEHLADRLSACGFVITDAKGKPDLDILATKALWSRAYADLPRAFCAPPLSEGDVRGRWFVHVAAAIAEDLAAANPDWAPAAANRFCKLGDEQQFLANRLCKWTYPNGPIQGLEESGVEFIHHFYGIGSDHSRLYSFIFCNTPELKDGPYINWKFAVWLRIGWERGHQLTEDSSEIGIPKLCAEISPENHVFTCKLLAKLTANSGDKVEWDDLAAGCIDYIRERLGLLSDGHSPVACVHALDYGFWMALGLRGLLPIPANTADTISTITKSPAKINSVDTSSTHSEWRKGI